MKKIIKKLAITLLIIIPLAVIASTQVPKARKIVAMSTYGDRAVVVYEPAFTNSEGCAGALQDHVAAIELPDNEAVFSQALAAFTAGQSVGFGLSGCDNNYGGGVPKIYRIDVDAN